MLSELPWWHWALQALVLLSAYLGAELNSRAQVRGFQVWLFSNVVSLVLHVASGYWVLCLLDIAFVRINLRGMREWTRARIGDVAVPRSASGD